MIRFLTILLLLPAVVYSGSVNRNGIDSNVITTQEGLSIIVLPGYWKHSLLYVNDQALYALPENETISAYSLCPQSRDYIIEVARIEPRGSASPYYAACLIASAHDGQLDVMRVLSDSLLWEAHDYRKSHVAEVVWWDHASGWLLVNIVTMIQEGNLYRPYHGYELWDAYNGEFLADLSPRMHVSEFRKLESDFKPKAIIQVEEWLQGGGVVEKQSDASL